MKKRVTLLLCEKKPTDNANINLEVCRSKSCRDRECTHHAVSYGETPMCHIWHGCVKAQRDLVQTQIHGENIILIFMKYLINYKVLEEYESFTQVSDLANEIFI